MTKITLSNIGTGTAFQTAITTINSNNDAIETAFENTLSRDGTTPNTMSSNLDMNSNRIVNLPDAIGSSEPITLGQATILNGNGTLTLIPSGGLTGQALTKNSNTSYDVSWVTQGGVTINATTVTGGTSLGVLYNNAGTVGNATVATFQTQNSTQLFALGNNIASGLARSTPGKTFLMLLDRTVNWSGINDNSVADFTDLTAIDSVSNQYCSFAVATRTTNTAFNWNHICAFEDLKNYVGSGTLANDWSFLSGPTATGAVTARKGFYAQNPAGAGAITTNTAFHSDAQTRGTTNWAFFATAPTPSYFGGNVLIGTAGASPSTQALMVNKNVTTTLPTALISTANLVQIANADGSGTNIELQSYGTNAPSVGLRTSRNTMASPSATQSGDAIGSVFATGFGTNTWGLFDTVIQSTALENFSNTAHGSAWDFYTTTITTTSLALRMRIGSGLMLNTYTTDPGAGALLASASIKSNGATSGIGYATGAGGTVTQITSRTTGVTLNKVSGQITMFTAAGSATAASFTVTNSAVATTDTIICNVGSGGTNKYVLTVTAVGSGSFEITFFTTGGTASDTPVINFTVIKGVTA